MASQVFYRKWRPQSFAEVAGQEHVTRTLKNALAQGRLAHAYLLCGPRGTGKTSTGRVLAKAVNCLAGGKGEPCNACALCQAISEGRAMDVIEIDAASNRGIDEIRQLRERVGFTPSQARYKVYIIDEVHMLTDAASNALLKTLEEPPPHVIFVLATTEPHKVLPTILSRCQRFDFRRLSQTAVVARLEYVCQQEGIQCQAEALRLISRAATGSLRDAENLLEQLVTYYGPKVEVEHVRALLGFSDDQRARELARHIIKGDVSTGLVAINSVADDGLDLRQFNRELLEYLRRLLLVKSGAPQAVDATAEELAEMKELVARASLEHIIKAVKLFGSIDLRLDNYSPLPLELALVEYSIRQPEPAVSSAERTPPKKEPPEAPPPRATAQKTPTKHPTPAELTGEAEAPPKSPVQKAPSPAPAVPAAPAPAPVLVVPTDKPVGVEFFRQHWKDFLGSLKGLGSSGTLDALLRNACEPVDLDGDTLVLGVYYPFHKQKIEDTKYRHIIEKRLSEVFGSTYKVRCVLTPREKKAPSPQVNNPLVEGPLVKAALEMGAVIVEEAEEK